MTKEINLLYLPVNFVPNRTNKNVTNTLISIFLHLINLWQHVGFISGVLNEIPVLHKITINSKHWDRLLLAKTANRDQTSPK